MKAIFDISLKKISSLVSQLAFDHGSAVQPQLLNLVF